MWQSSGVLGSLLVNKLGAGARTQVDYMQANTLSTSIALTPFFIILLLFPGLKERIHWLECLLDITKKKTPTNF